MPHKRNPVVAERICGLARIVRAAVPVGLENVVLWHERDISHSSADRVVLPDAFLALDYMLDRFTWLVEGLVVDAPRMRANLESGGGIVFSQRLLLALVASGLSRDDAYRLVQRHALRAQSGEGDLHDLAKADPEVFDRVGANGFARAFDLDDVLRHTGTIVDRLSDIELRTQEPAHV